MTNARHNEITAHARQAAMQARAGWAVKPAPSTYTAEEVALWMDRFDAAMKGGV